MAQLADVLGHLIGNRDVRAQVIPPYRIPHSRARFLAPGTINVDNCQFVWTIERFVDSLNIGLNTAEGMQFSALLPQSFSLVTDIRAGRATNQKLTEGRVTLRLNKYRGTSSTQNPQEANYLSLSLTVEPLNMNLWAKCKVYIGTRVNDSQQESFSFRNVVRPPSGDTQPAWREHETQKSDVYIMYDQAKMVEFPNFIDVNYVSNEANGLLVKGNLTICCELSIVHGDSFRISEKQESNASDLATDITSLLWQKDTFDVKLVVGKRVFGAHKVILGARSSVFKAMFTHEMKESKDGTVKIDDIKPEVFEQLLRFIYTTKVPKLAEVVSDLLVAADRYDLGKLKILCEQEIMKQLNANNAAEMLILADRVNAEKLKQFAMKFIKDNSDVVTATPGWQVLLLEHPVLITSLFNFKRSSTEIEIVCKRPRSSSPSTSGKLPKYE